MKEVTATWTYYTDGSGTPGLGTCGYGWVQVDGCEVLARGSGQISCATNNRAELVAIIEVIARTPPHYHVEIHTDSELCIRQASGQYRTNKNMDLWNEYQALCRGRAGVVTLLKVKAHSGDRFNDMADVLAGSARQGVAV